MSLDKSNFNKIKNKLIDFSISQNKLQVSVTIIELLKI